jgi:GAF domain-containing protein
VIGIYRQEVRPFSGKQIALLQNFAAQAVVAMENARLLTETRQALEQQTATAEVLQVINSSPGDLTPVFDAMLERARRLCEPAFGVMLTWDGERFHRVAWRGAPPEVIEATREPVIGPPGSPGYRIAHGENVVSIADLATNEATRPAPAMQTWVRLGVHSYIAVALRKEETLLGAIVIYRLEVRPFTEREIALLQNFAAQAVIAMENARLITETREALAQQTATAEVLQVINSSPGNFTPVFDAILEKAHSLCDVAYGSLELYDGENFRSVAERGLPQAFAEMLRQGYPASDNPATRPLIEGSRVTYIADLADTDYAITQSAVELVRARTLLRVPLRRENMLLGMIACARQEVRSFTEKEIALLENFAAQAVIAIENARLLTETREALEQQTATAEVLQVINSSPGDLAPVFDAMLGKAARLCEAAFGTLWIRDGDTFQIAAHHGVPADLEKALHNSGPIQPREGSALRLLLDGEDVLHFHDLAAAALPDRPGGRRAALIQLGGARTTLWVGLRKDDRLVGVVHLYRREVRPFTDRQISLLQNFAAQAVIAMENARLLTETREALEQQTATAEVLQVINSSPGDLAPVFDAILEKAHTLCGATHGALALFDGKTFRAAAVHGYSEEFAEELRRGISVSQIPQFPLLASARLIHYPDVRQIDDPVARTVAERGGVRTNLVLPLRKDGALLGIITCNRQEVRPFSDKQIALLQNFAAQAVIAMENARLLTETREALEQQTATAEVLAVINSSPGELAPVFDAILEKAHTLCAVAYGSLELYDGEFFRAVAVRGLSDAFANVLRQGTRAADSPAYLPLIEQRRFAQVVDAAQIDHPTFRSAAGLEGIRTVLFIPLRRDDALLGIIACARREVRLFSEKEIALLENFAAQAVIAMDNARLLDEIRQRQAELRVTFDNMGDGVAMFDSELRLAAWNLNFQRILELPDALLAERTRVGDFVRYLATHGEYGAVDVETEVRRLSERVGTQWSAERTRPDGRVIEVRSNPVPGGGVVLIYSDITERKRAEAEIRAARDTAERALQELQTAQASLVHAQKMAALGQLTAGIAHEIKNPLNFVNNFAELSGELLQELRETTAPVAAALDDDTRAEVDEIVEMLRGNLAKIAEHGKRADGIVKSMLEHSRGVSGERRAVDINALVEEALNLAYHGARAQDASFNVTLEREFDQGLAPIDLAPQEMTRVFLNLFGNGFYAAARRQRDGAGPDFRPTLRVTTRDLGEAVEVRVRDNGTGIAPEIRDKLFQPFVTTKPTGEGTGLGLSITWDIVTQQHGGTIAVDSVPGEFTEFTIRLPQHAAADLAAVQDAP